jgi:nucleotidyltransferase substrate binding protein (TIGR01987 family)
VSQIILGKIDISTFLSAYQQFHNALPTAKSDLEKAGMIQYFEFTYELAWKTLKRILEVRGKQLNSPKPIFREAALEGLIDDPELWFEFLEDRNNTVHTYNKNIADDIFSDFHRFDIEIGTLIQRIINLK